MNCMVWAMDCNGGTLDCNGTMDYMVGPWIVIAHCWGLRFCPCVNTSGAIDVIVYKNGPHHNIRSLSGVSCYHIIVSRWSCIKDTSVCST